MQLVNIFRTILSENVPLRNVKLYHGSNRRFDKFDMSYFGHTDDGFYGRGIYFTNSKSEAAEYGNIIYTVTLSVKKPFVLFDNGYMYDDQIILNRHNLSKVYPDKKGLDPDLTLPPGYTVHKSYDDSRDYAYWEVWPDKTKWNTENEIYGERMPSKKLAIVTFNDQLNKVSYDLAWLSSLLKQLGRDTLTDALDKHGYDSLIVIGGGGVTEYVVWDTDLINMLDVE